jgi:glucosylglycerate synthase
MSELDPSPRQTQDQIAEIGSADLVVGVLSSGDAHETSAVALVWDSLAALSERPKTVVIHNDGAGHSDDGAADDPAPDHSFFVVRDRSFDMNPTVATAQSVGAAYQSLFATGVKLGARACCVVASNLETVTPQWILQLAQPVLEKEFDLVTPCYARHRFEGLINNGIISPLHQALYGRQIQNPMGPDLGCSQRLLQKLNGSRFDATPMLPLARMAPEAVRSGFQVVQTHVGERLYPPTDWVNLSSVLAQVLGPVFLDVESNAAFWQKVRGSQPVVTLGQTPALLEETGAMDGGHIEVARMIDSFQLGIRNLQEIWGLVLPPATLLELRKLSRQAVDQFRMPDQLWVRIVYDFALGHRLRTISRDHLLRALTPLYLGWVASYALEMEASGAPSMDERLQRLGREYEAAKPYFVSRWRWPDRFSP